MSLVSARKVPHRRAMFSWVGSNSVTIYRWDYYKNTHAFAHSRVYSWSHILLEGCMCLHAGLLLSDRSLRLPPALYQPLIRALAIAISILQSDFGGRRMQNLPI